MRNRNKKSLAVKLKEAKERTRQWALGVNVEFPLVERKREDRFWAVDIRKFKRHEK